MVLFVMVEKRLRDPCKDCKAEYGPGDCIEYCSDKRDYVAKLQETTKHR